MSISKVYPRPNNSFLTGFPHLNFTCANNPRSQNNFIYVKKILLYNKVAHKREQSLMSIFVRTRLDKVLQSSGLADREKVIGWNTWFGKQDVASTGCAGELLSDISLYKLSLAHDWIRLILYIVGHFIQRYLAIN